MKKMVMFSIRASSNQVRFVPFLAKYFDVHHYFYKDVDAAWKKVPLGDRGHLLDCWFKWHSRFFTFKVLSVLKKHNPDIIFIGAMSIPANYLAYLWGRFHGKKIGVFTERSRVMSTGKPRGFGLQWRILRFLYRKLDFIMTVDDDAVPQFRDTFRFGDKVVSGHYPSDIGKYYNTPNRLPKDKYVLIFPNRMIPIYNPIGAVNIFAKVLKRHPETVLKMNAAGELREQVEKRIKDLGVMDNVIFLEGLKSWDDLIDVYASCDIMFLPANFSNGNFSIYECAVSGMACIISNKIKGDSGELIVRDDVLELSEENFVERICYYIEHPYEISKNVDKYRKKVYFHTFEATAKLYFNIIERMCQ